MDGQIYVRGAEIISLFCRLTVNMKKDLPIRSSEMGLLIFAVKTEKPVTSVQAAHFFKVSKPMVATMVRSLVTKGYLIKKPSGDDGRSYILTPTEQAKTLVEQTYSEYYKSMQLLESGMGTKNFCQLLQSLEQANEILSEEKDNG